MGKSGKKKKILGAFLTTFWRRGRESLGKERGGLKKKRLYRGGILMAQRLRFKTTLFWSNGNEVKQIASPLGKRKKEEGM